MSILPHEKIDSVNTQIHTSPPFLQSHVGYYISAELPQEFPCSPRSLQKGPGEYCAAASCTAAPVWDFGCTPRQQRVAMFHLLLSLHGNTQCERRKTRKYCETEARRGGRNRQNTPQPLILVALFRTLLIACSSSMLSK